MTARTDHERAEFEKWIGIKPCGAAHDFGWEAWKARAALAATPASALVDKSTELQGSMVDKNMNLQGLEAAPVVLPEPFALYDGEKWYANEEAAICSCANMQKLQKVYTEQQVRALLATGGQAQAVQLLAADHSGMKVDYRGLFSQVQRALKRTDPGYAEMLRQLEGHLQELGQRWYAGDTDVVDEILQLYCIERDARKTVGVTATAAPHAQAEHIKALIEVSRMPNQEHVADAHNAAVRHLRAIAAAKGE